MCPTKPRLRRKAAFSVWSSYTWQHPAIHHADELDPHKDQSAVFKSSFGQLVWLCACVSWSSCIMTTWSTGLSRFPLWRRQNGKREDPGDEVGIVAFIMTILS